METHEWLWVYELIVIGYSKQNCPRSIIGLITQVGPWFKSCMTL
jgi:hypothetical protein